LKYCSQCGRPVQQRIPPGDNLLRYVCDACSTIHYQNPRMVVGCVVEKAGQILLCKRDIEPRHGFWTVPAGFMENGETLEQGAARETREEALAEVRMGALFAVVNVVHAHQVHLMFKAALEGDAFGAGHETSEAAMFEEGDIPWDEIAFPSVEFALQRYLEDRRRGETRLHVTEVARRLTRR